jgi:hypothetical protein
MQLREDEIEALLKLDGKILLLLENNDLLAQGGQRYTALIRGYFQDINDQRSIARAADTRIEAIREVWEAYKNYYDAPVEVKNSAESYLEDAMGNVYHNMIDLLKGKKT